VVKPGLKDYPTFGKFRNFPKVVLENFEKSENSCMFAKTKIL